MEYTPIHRLLGVAPGPLTTELLGDAVDAQIPEARDLDWKRSLPTAPGDSDFPKDVAAMANGGGGMIVYGVIEHDKMASSRHDVGEVTESQERTLRAVAAAKISPPILNLRIERIGSEEDLRALSVIVPPSSTPPHLIFDNQSFRAPIRNDADTFWMSEPELAAAYRARFETQRDAELELSRLYDWASQRSRPSERAWLVAAARPQVQPALVGRLSGEKAREILQSGQVAADHIHRTRLPIFRLLDLGNPRPGLRRQVFHSINGIGSRDARMSVHDRGSVTLDMALGGIETGRDDDPGTKVAAAHLEEAIVDFVCVVQAASEIYGWGSVDTEVGIEWDGADPLLIVAHDEYGVEVSDGSTPLRSFERIRTSLSFVGPASRLEAQARELALDALNQAGIRFTRGFLTPDPL